MTEDVPRDRAEISNASDTASDVQHADTEHEPAVPIAQKRVNTNVPTGGESKANAGPNDDVQRILAQRISDLESQIHSTEHRSREVAKRHKKLLREVQRIVTDKSRKPDDVIEALQQRTLSAINEAWQLEKRIPELEVKIDKLGRQSQSDQAELAKVYQELEKGVTIRNKLQDLCRELQKQNRETQNESRLYHEQEKSKRQSMVENVNSTVASITERLDQQALTVSKQAEENALLKDQLKRMMEAVQASESHGQQQAKAHELERQIWEGKQQQQAEVIKKLEEANEVYGKRYEIAVKEHDLLSQQVKDYHDRFQEFQDMLKKSNDMFDTLRNDGKAMRQKEKELLEKNSSLKQQYEKAGLMLLKATEENASQKETIAKLTLANERLQSLCRALQASKASPCTDAAANKIIEKQASSTEAATTSEDVPLDEAHRTSEE